MLQQSDAFMKAFASDNRTVSVKATVGDKSYTADDILTVEYDSAALTGEQLGLGSTYENSVKISFVNLIEGIQAKDKVTVQIGVKLPDGTFEYAPLGDFFVTDEIEMDRNNNQTSITADDGMCKLEGIYTPKVTVPVSIVDMVTDIANQAGVLVNEDNISHLPATTINSLPNKQTYRTVLGWLAMMVPGYATFDRQGKLCLKGISKDTYEVTPDNYEFQGLVKNENPYTLGGITIAQTAVVEDTTDVTSADDTDVIDADDTTDADDSVDVDTSDKKMHVGETTGSQLSVQNDLMSEDRLNTIWDAVKSLQYYPFTLNWFGNPAVEVGDWLEISDTKGNHFTVPNNSYAITFDGGVSAVSSTAETVTSSSDWSYNGTLEQTVKQIVDRYNASGTYTYYTVTEPTNPHEGDLWYKPNGRLTELLIYKNGQWTSLVSDVTGQEIADEVDEAQKAIKGATDVANAANQLAVSNENALSLKIGTDKFNSKISELTNDINLRVKRDDLISQINLEAGQTLIQSGKILLDAPTVTFSGEAFIPSAAIKDLNASKLTAGTIDANLINIVNMNGKNISAGSISADKLSADAIQVGFNSLGDTIHIDNDSLDFFNNGNKLLSLDNQGLNVYYKNDKVGQIFGHQWPSGKFKGLSFGALDTADFMSWDAWDDETNSYQPKLIWTNKPIMDEAFSNLEWGGFANQGFTINDDIAIWGRFYAPGLDLGSRTNSSISVSDDNLIKLTSWSGGVIKIGEDGITIIGSDISFSKIDGKTTNPADTPISIYDLADRVKNLEDNYNAN